MNRNGLIIWEGSSAHDGAPLVVIMTGLTNASANTKTGDMVQTFILRADIDPMAALKDGSDSSICGACPLRGRMLDGRMMERACYVNVGQSPLSVWRAYDRGSYARVTPEVAGEMVAGRAIRLGAYGDPAMVPVSVWHAITARATSHTGYTHQWRTRPEFSGLVMASADSVEDRREARGLGWRAFFVVPASAELPTGAMECSATRERNPLQCADCGACAGTRHGASPNAVDVVIRAHGAGAKYVTA